MFSWNGIGEAWGLGGAEMLSPTAATMLTHAWSCDISNGFDVT